MSRAAEWTLRRWWTDRTLGRIHPGKHHPNMPVGLQPTPFGGLEDRAGFRALARVGAR